MFAKNIATFLLNLVKEGKVELNREDEITRETLFAWMEKLCIEVEGVDGMDGLSSGSPGEALPHHPPY
jgi:hypothetical protein